MKMRSIQQRILLLIFAGTSLSLLNTSCEPQDLEAIEPYQYQFPEFSNLPQFQEVKLIPPKFVDYDFASISLNKEAMELIEDILTSINRSGLTENNISILKVFESEKKSFPESTLSQLSVAQIDQILNTDLILPEECLDLFIRVDQRENIKYFLPNYIPPRIEGIIFELYTIPPPTGRINFQPEDILARINSTNPETLVTPCAKAAEESYQSNLNTYNNAFLQQLIIGQKYYQAQQEQITKLRETQIEVLKDSVNQSSLKLRSLGIAINSAANQGLQSGKITRDVFNGIKVFTVAFLVKSRRSLQLTRLNTIATLDEVYKKNLQQIKIAQTTYEMELSNQLEIHVKNLKQIRLQVLNNCHNQGGGSD